MKKKMQGPDQVMIEVVFIGDIFSVFKVNRQKVLGDTELLGLKGLDLWSSLDQATHYVCYTFDTAKQAEHARKWSTALGSVMLLFDDSTCKVSRVESLGPDKMLPADIEKIEMEV